MTHWHSRHMWMHHESVTLVVEHDWVNNMFDDHGGLVQMIECDRKEQAVMTACHMLEGTICHLLKRCGDHRERWQTCEHGFDPREVFILPCIPVHLCTLAASPLP